MTIAAAAALITACDDGAAPPSRPDAGLADALAPDALAPDATVPVADGGTLSYGTHIADNPANIIAVTADDTEILYTDGQGDLRSVAPDGTNDRIVSTDAVLIYPGGPTTWIFGDIVDDRTSGAVFMYQQGGAGVTRLVDDAAYRIIFREPNGDRAIVSAGYDRATSTGYLVLLEPDGTATTLTASISVGRWDPDDRRFEGGCTVAAAFTGAGDAMIAACNPGEETRTLRHIDLTSGAETVVAGPVQAYLSVSPSRSFVLWRDTDGLLYGALGDGTMVTPLAERSAVRTVRHLNDDRFAYSNTDSELKVARWPFMTPTRLHVYAGRSLRSASPDGRFVFASQSFSSRGDLNIFSTTEPMTPRITTPNRDAYRAEAPFSADGRWAYWYTNLDADLIGDLIGMDLDGDAPPIHVAAHTYYNQNVADPDRVMLMTGAQKVQIGRSEVIVADLAVRTRDGSGPVIPLASGVHATDFALFDGSRRIVYRVPQGSWEGVWVRSLEP